MYFADLQISEDYIQRDVHHHLKWISQPSVVPITAPTIYTRMRICTKHIVVEVILYCNSTNCLIQSQHKNWNWGCVLDLTFLWILICFNVRSINFRLSLIYQKPKCSNDFYRDLYILSELPKYSPSTLEFRESTTAALIVCDLAKYISHPGLDIYFFSISPLKLKLKLQLQMGGRLLGISKPPGPIIMITNQKQRTAIRSYLLHSSLPGVRFCCAFYQPQQTIQKTIFCWAKPICIHFPSSNFNLQGPILSTLRVILRDMMCPLLLLVSPVPLA
jgi:hypothetical protein